MGWLGSGPGGSGPGGSGPGGGCLVRGDVSPSPWMATAAGMGMVN